jgi:hypothetical protein
MSDKKAPISLKTIHTDAMQIIQSLENKEIQNLVKRFVDMQVGFGRLDRLISVTKEALSNGYPDL